MQSSPTSPLPEATPLSFLGAAQARLGSIPAPIRRLLTYVVALALALLVFGGVLLLLGKDPIAVYRLIFSRTLTDEYERSEIVVKMIPFILCALAVAIPAQVGLVNVGGEGQIYIGALFTALIALSIPDVPAPILVPLMALAGMIGGGLWAGIVGLLRAYVGLNETICSLLLGYVAQLIVQFTVHGPLKDPGSMNLPYSAQFSQNAVLPPWGDSRVTIGIVFALIAVAVYFWVLNYTRWGYKMRVIGGNAEAARRSGIHIDRYIIITMIFGGAMAGLAGMIEVAAIQGRLRDGLSNGYGFIGFLVAWIALQRPFGIVVVAALLGMISVGGDLFQIGVRLPSSTVNILMALILFFMLRNQNSQKQGA